MRALIHLKGVSVNALCQGLTAGFRAENGSSNFLGVGVAANSVSRYRSVPADTGIPRRLPWRLRRSEIGLKIQSENLMGIPDSIVAAIKLPVGRFVMPDKAVRKAGDPWRCAPCDRRTHDRRCQSQRSKNPHFCPPKWRRTISAAAETSSSHPKHPKWFRTSAQEHPEQDSPECQARAHGNDQAEQRLTLLAVSPAMPRKCDNLGASRVGKRFLPVIGRDIW